MAYVGDIVARDYQLNTVVHVRTREELKPDVRMNIQSPTGTGKTIDMALLLLDPIPQLVLTPRRIILDQLSKVLTRYNIPHGFRCSGRIPKPSAPIQLAMMQSEWERSFKKGSQPIHEGCKRVHVDEIHMVGGVTGQAILTRYHVEGASIITYTATPVNLGGIVDENHVSISIPAAINSGWLLEPRVFAIEQPPQKLLERLKRDSKGEYLPKDVAAITNPQRIKGRVIQNYKRLSPDGRAFILFANSIKASIWWAQYMTGAGLPCAHIDGDDIWVDNKFYNSQDRAKRDEIFNRVADRKSKFWLNGLCNRFVLREGVDLPCIGHAILTCAVGSRMSFVQMCGRILRPYEGQEYGVIQDHSGSAIGQPALDSAEPWYWDLPAGMSEKLYIAAMREEIDPEPIVCPECSMMRYYGRVCPHCGFAYRKHARWVEQSNGTLKLIEGRSYKPRKVKHEEGDEKRWERSYWGAMKNSPDRTFEQIYAYNALNMNWRYMRRDLPFMPRDQYNWFLPVGEVERSELL